MCLGLVSFPELTDNKQLLEFLCALLDIFVTKLFV